MGGGSGFQLISALCIILADVERVLTESSAVILLVPCFKCVTPNPGTFLTYRCTKNLQRLNKYSD